MVATTSAPITGPLPLTRGRRAALVIGVPVCLAFVASTGLSLVGSFAEATRPASYIAPANTRTLTLNVDGQLTLKPATAGRVTLTGTAHYALTPAAPSVHSAGGDTTVGYNCPIPVGDCELDATVTVPPTVTTLTAYSGAGNDTVTGTSGAVTLSTGSGNLSVSHASGPLSLTTDSGNIQVSAITSATLSASTGSGDIRFAGAKSTTISANTNSGSIDETGITATTITASSGNGDISIVFTGAPPHNVHVNTDSGNISLILPPGSGPYRVSANSDSGSVNDGSIARSPTAANSITASTGSGTVTISYAK